MKKAMIAGVVMWMAGLGVNAQEQGTPASRTNVAAEFSETSAAQVSLLNVGTEGSASANAMATATGDASAAPAAALPAAPEPTPAARPRYIFGERDDYRWQLGVGFEYFRLQSSAFNANLLGVNTTVTYYTNSWFGLEGQVVTGFSTGTYFGSGDHAKIFGGAGGFRIGSRRAKWEPWAHGLAGGAHLQPQTAEGSRSGIMAIAGGGVDYRVHARLSFRVETDWVYTTFFSQSQNSFQGIGGVVLHF
jgi:hypothetical protein